MLNIQNFSKTYDGKKKAVDNLSLSIEPGDIYGFIGANGAGKTSTIKAVVGVHDFDSGSIRISRHSIKEEPLICKSVLAYIPDNPDLYEHLTGYQYISFIADSDTDRAEKTKKYGEMFEMTGRSHLISLYRFAIRYDSLYQKNVSYMQNIIRKMRVILIKKRRKMCYTMYGLNKGW